MSKRKLYFPFHDLGQADNLFLWQIASAHNHSYQHTLSQNDYNSDWVIYSIFMGKQEREKNKVTWITQPDMAHGNGRNTTGKNFFSWMIFKSLNLHEWE